MMNNKVSKSEKKLLIIEDESMNNILHETLIETGYSAVVIPLDINAVTSVETLSPEFVIININKAIVSGVMILCKIKQAYPELPVIVYVENSLFNHVFLKFADECIFRSNFAEPAVFKDADSIIRVLEKYVN